MHFGFTTLQLKPLYSTNQKQNQTQSRFYRSHFSSSRRGLLEYIYNSNWLIVLSTSPMIGRYNCFGLSLAAHSAETSYFSSRDEKKQIP